MRDFLNKRQKNVPVIEKYGEQNSYDDIVNRNNHSVRKHMILHTCNQREGLLSLRVTYMTFNYNSSWGKGGNLPHDFLKRNYSKKCTQMLTLKTFVNSTPFALANFELSVSGAGAVLFFKNAYHCPNILLRFSSSRKLAKTRMVS